MIRVAISGAGGKLATPIAEAIAASDDLELTALYNPNRAGAEMHGMTVTGAPSEVDADVVVETAHPDVVLDNLKAWRDKGLAAVVGTSGFTPERLEQLRGIWGTDGPAALGGPELLDWRGAHDEVRRRGGVTFRGGGDHRASSLDEA